jgi:hypothetical protein
MELFARQFTFQIRDVAIKYPFDLFDLLPEVLELF